MLYSNRLRNTALYHSIQFNTLCFTIQHYALYLMTLFDVYFNYKRLLTPAPGSVWSPSLSVYGEMNA